MAAFLCACARVWQPGILTIYKYTYDKFMDILTMSFLFPELAVRRESAAPVSRNVEPLKTVFSRKLTLVCCCSLAAGMGFAQSLQTTQGTENWPVCFLSRWRGPRSTREDSLNWVWGGRGTVPLVPRGIIHSVYSDLLPVLEALL